MKVLLVDGHCWDNPPMEPESKGYSYIQNEILCNHTSEEMKDSIVKLRDREVITDNV